MLQSAAVSLPFHISAGQEVVAVTDGRAAVPLRFEILGDVRVLRNGDPVDLGPAKQRAVLAVLLLQPGRPVPTHQIVDAVWGDDPPENGANVVQKYVAGLRRVLDPDRAPRTPGELLALTGSGYVLRAAEGTVDADEFLSALTRSSAECAAGRPADAAETLRTALALWRGQALAGLTGPVFEAARARLAEARATAWEKWADIELARGLDTALIPDLARLIEEFPLREGLRAQLMIALHQGGRQAEALAAFRDAREYFLDEFGAEPGERMQEAHRKILRGEPFYAEPVDPWAPDDASVPIQAYAPPDWPTPTPYGYPPFLAAHQFQRPPPRRRFPIVEILFAAALPLLTCSLGGWMYFVYAALRHRAPRHYIAAGIYGALFAVGVVFLAIDPSPVDGEDLSGAETTGLLLFTVLGFVAAVHGSVVAARSGDGEREWALREQARQFAAFDPIRALHLGIGRPDLIRGFDDGGLIDLNHVPGAELARHTGLSLPEAYRIVTDRTERGPYLRAEDLVLRGLVPAKAVRRMAPRLICIAPGPSLPATGAAPWSQPGFDRQPTAPAQD
jgi:DNA-binding SARP family transcriptional activator